MTQLKTWLGVGLPFPSWGVGKLQDPPAPAGPRELGRDSPGHWGGDRGAANLPADVLERILGTAWVHGAAPKGRRDGAQGQVCRSRVILFLLPSSHRQENLSRANASSPGTALGGICPHLPVPHCWVCSRTRLHRHRLHSGEELSRVHPGTCRGEHNTAATSSFGGLPCGGVSYKTLLWLN